MNKYYTISLALLLTAFLSCGTNINITNPSVFDTTGIAFGTEDTFDIVAWNIERFPKDVNNTIQLLKDIIPALKVECIAIQEVTSVGSIYQLVNQIPGWSYYISSSGDTKTAIIYNSTAVTIDSSATIFTGLNNPFPRPPLLVRLNWQGNEIIVISLHLKAFGDNYIDTTNPNDEEMRRRYACQLIDQYISDYYKDKKVIVLGDWNDQIHEPIETNVFLSFLDKPDEYYFTDMSIAQNLNSQNYSYPRTSSHIDHILITNELFSAFNLSNNYAKTLLIENYVVGGLLNYYKYISDHRPVASRFKFNNDR